MNSLINYNISQLGVPNINIILLCDISFTYGFLVVFINTFKNILSITRLFI